MKRTLCLFLALILAVGICFSAPVTITASAAFTLESGEENQEDAIYKDSETGLKFKITDTEDKTVEVCGYESSPTNLEIPATVTINENEYSVTTIGDSAFNSCKSLTSVTIPDSVTTIGEYAFYSCKALVTVKLGKGVTTIGSLAFYRCTLLASIEIPQSVTTIGNSAFGSCSALETVIIHDSVTTIGEYAFDNCKALVTVKLGKGVTTIGSYAFYRCTLLASIEIPQSVTTIGNHAFYGCTSLASVIIPGSVTTIGNSAFYGCTSLASVIIPDSVTTIGNRAFGGCSALETVIIPDSVTTIGENAFDSCKALVTVKLGKGVTTIGSYTFYKCTSLASVIIPDSVTTIGNSAFYGCTSLASVIIPGSVTTSGNNAFYGCSALETVIIRDGVTTIGVYAFYGCTSLASVIIPDSVTTIGEYAFKGCTSLASVIIPDSVTTIGNNAFYGCTSLASVIILANITTIGTRAFSYCDALSAVNVPCDWDENTYAFDGGVEINYRHTYKNGKCTVANCDNACAHETITDGVCVDCGGKYCGNTENDKVVWFYDEATTILTISGSGDMAKFDSRDMLPPWANYRDSIKKVVISDGVTNIATYAFCNCTALKDITIGKNVATIDYSAFLGCSALESITVDDNNANFSSSEDGILFNKDKSVLICYPAGKEGDCEVPSGVTTIGNNAFSNCVKLQSVTIPVSVTTIGEENFAGCENVNLIVEPGSKAHEFAKTNSIPYIFNGYNKAETAQIEKLTFTEMRNDNSEVIEYSLSFCDKEISGALNIPATYNGKPVTTIGNFVFEDCTALSEITIPKSVTTIGAMAFCRCSSLETITIPKSVATIGGYAFIGCDKLTSIIVDENNINYSNSEDGVLFDKNTETLICYPAGKTETSYTVPESVTKIGEAAFMDCTALTSVTIPESVTTIGVEAFYGCTALETVTISGIETTIGNNAFYDCPNVTLLVDENSNAHAYALEKNIKYITYVGGSGELGKLTFTPIYKEADNENSEITGYSVTARDTSISGALTIPSTYNGKPVTKIGNEAFLFCKSLTSVVIPDSVVSLDEKAFYVCVSLETIILSNKITVIPKEAFAYCESLKTLPVTENVASIGECAFYGSGKYSKVSLSGVTIGSEAFRFCGITELTLEKCKLNDASVFINNNIEKLTISETDIPDEMFCGNAYIKTLSAENSVLGSKSFKGCPSLKSVTVSGGEIANYAFQSSYSLEKLTIKNIVSVGEFAFNNCGLLETVEVDATKISEGAFALCDSLKNVKLGDASEIIEKDVFNNCRVLTEVVISKNVTKIDVTAFNGCENLKYIFFEGTEDAQKTIGDALETNAKIHYGSSTHTFNENYTVDVEPTCTEKGSESQHCKYCDLTQNERPVKENGHTSVNGGTEGAHTICSVCKEPLSTTHNLTSKITTAPTCTEEGVETFTCECGYTYTESVKELGHDKVSHSAKSATCESIGWYAYDTCSRCDYTTYKEKAKLGHDIVIDKAVAPTCTKTGLTEGSHCTRCNDKTVKQNVIPTKAHTEVTVTGKAATCTATGLTDGKKCSVCGVTTVEQQTIAKKAHTEVTVTGKSATCTQAGLTDGKKCSVCGTVTKAQQTIAKKGHTEVTVTGKAATCTETGLTDGKKCSVCGATTVAQQTIAKKGHTEVTVTGKAATCTETGLTDGKKCSVCGAVTKAQETIKATGHKEVVIPAVAPTYTTVGKTEGKKCSVCGIVTVAQKDVAKLTLATPVVTAVANNSGIKVNWNNVENAQSYVLYKRVFDATANKWSKWKIVKTGLTGFEYIDSDVVLGTKYRYTVRAKNGDTLSPYKTTTTVKYNVTPTVKVANDSNGVKVTWTTVANATGYRVYRSTLSNGKWSNWKNMGTAKSNKTSWTDKSVKSNVTYKYTVRAVYNKVLSSYNKAGASVLFLSTPTVKIANNASGIKVSWNKIAGATGYTVYSSTYDAKTKKWSNWKNRGTAKATATSWTDKKVESGVKYKYTVRAVNGKTKSTYVSSGDLLYLAQPAVTVKSVSNGINISWTKSSGATEYKIYRSEYNAKTKKWSSWKGIKSAKSTVKSYTDKTTKKGVKYKYTVRAVNGKVKSSYKSSGSITK